MAKKKTRKRKQGVTLTDVFTQVLGVRTMSEKQSEDIKTLNFKMDSMKRDFTARFDILEGRTGRVEGHLTGVEDRLTGVEDRLTGVEDRLTGVENKLIEHDKRFDAQDAKIQAVSDDVQAVRNDIRLLDQKIDGHGSRISVIEQGLNR